MKIISTEYGRVLQFYVADEVAPLRGMYVPEMLRLVKERYGFSVEPTIQETLKTGAKFEHGRLVAGTKKINIRELGIFNDGIAAAATNTDDAEYVLEDVENWIKQMFGMREAKTRKLRQFDSSLVVEFENAVESAIRIFQKLKGTYEKALKETYKQDLSIGLSGFDFNVDPLSVTAPLRTNFGIARRTGISYLENRYFSTATLRTQTHTALLESLDELLATKK
jgi:hypothetical protein